MLELENKLLTILNEKDTKIIPTNIRQGVQIFDVVGAMEDKPLEIFSSETEMRASTTLRDESICKIIPTIETRDILTNLTTIDGVVIPASFTIPKSSGAVSSIWENEETGEMLKIRGDSNLFGSTIYDKYIEYQLAGQDLVSYRYIFDDTTSSYIRQPASSEEIKVIFTAPLTLGAKGINNPQICEIVSGLTITRPLQAMFLYSGGEFIQLTPETQLTEMYNLTQTIIGTNPLVPYEYSLLSYIESDGNQFIKLPMLDMDLKLSKPLNMEYTLQFTDLTRRESGSIWHLEGVGSGSGLTSEMFYIGWYGEPSTFYFNNFDNNEDIDTEIPADTNKHTFGVVSDSVTMTPGCYIDDVLVKETTKSTSGLIGNGKFEYPFYVFGYENSGGMQLNKLKFYNLRIFNHNDETLYDFYPVRRIADGVVGIYDIITKSFLTNGGSGEFTYQELGGV